MSGGKGRATPTRERPPWVFQYGKRSESQAVVRLWSANEKEGAYVQHVR
jgi:hypothetical protein